MTRPGSYPKINLWVNLNIRGLSAIAIGQTHSASFSYKIRSCSRPLLFNASVIWRANVLSRGLGSNGSFGGCISEAFINTLVHFTAFAIPGEGNKKDNQAKKASF
jgi:hypothetical protein